jgi:hypothetical protein
MLVFRKILISHSFFTVRLYIDRTSVVIAIIGVLIALLLPAIQAAREATDVSNV